MLYPNRKLGLRVELLDKLPNFSSWHRLGIGGEGEVFASSCNSPNGWKDVAVKIFHQPKPTGSFEEQLFALTTPAMIVATNARWANKIYGRNALLELLNTAQEQLENMGIGSDYQLESLQRSYVDFRKINLSGFTTLVRHSFEERGLPIPEELQGSRLLTLPNDYQGGLASYINTLVGYVANRWPVLGFPCRVFPKIPFFGIIDDKVSGPLSDFIGRMFLVMDFVPNSLQKLLLKGYEDHMNRYRGVEDQATILRGIAYYVSQHCPITKLQNVKTMLKVLGSLDICFADLKPENIGLTSSGEIVLLDSGSSIIKGARQDFATVDYLPNEETLLEGRLRNFREEYAKGELTGHPWLDLKAFDTIVTDAVMGGAMATFEASKRAASEKISERQSRLTARALKAVHK
ncbi:MAG: hypothetical protein NT141_01665 [candidate division WWE3 bacterium]|nr:hypothetical protein [candidate division WWE3 bacterium]